MNHICTCVTCQYHRTHALLPHHLSHLALVPEVVLNLRNLIKALYSKWMWKQGLLLTTTSLSQPSFSLLRYRWHNTHLRTHTHTHRLKIQHFNDIVFDSDGDMYLSFSRGVLRVSTKAMTVHSIVGGRKLGLVDGAFDRAEFNQPHGMCWIGPHVMLVVFLCVSVCVCVGIRLCAFLFLSYTATRKGMTWCDHCQTLLDLAPLLSLSPIIFQPFVGVVSVCVTYVDWITRNDTSPCFCVYI